MSEQSKGLQVKDFLGVFYREDRRLMVADEFEGTRDVGAELRQYLGKEIRLIAHHRPFEPVNVNEWGGGCCMFENVGYCPFGHHEDSRRAFSFNVCGVLREQDDQWFLEQETEQVECFMEFLVGHRSQIIITTVPDLASLEERIAAVTSDSPEGKTIEEIQQQITKTRDLLLEINRLKNDINV